jgi:hypothetical protein
VTPGAGGSDQRSRLLAAIESREARVGIIGLGYVGLPLARAFADAGCGVLFEHLKLSDRWVSCECGVPLDRDHNAAIHILNRSNRPGHGRRAIGSALAGLAREAVGL